MKYEGITTQHHYCIHISPILINEDQVHNFRVNQLDEELLSLLLTTLPSMQRTSMRSSSARPSTGPQAPRCATSVKTRHLQTRFSTICRRSSSRNGSNESPTRSSARYRRDTDSLYHSGANVEPPRSTLTPVIPRLHDSLRTRGEQAISDTRWWCVVLKTATLPAAFSPSFWSPLRS